MSVLINGVASDVLGITAITIDLVNQDSETCNISLGGSLGDAVPSALVAGSLVTVTVDGTKLFQGVAQSPSRSATGSTHGRVIMLEGPWARMARLYYTASVTDPISGSSYTTASVQLSGSLATAISSVVSYAASKGINVALGVVDVGSLIIPPMTFTDTTCASILQSLLRWSPSTISVTDYTAATPRLHILRRTATSLLAVSSPDKSTSYRRRDDLICSGVRITYLRPYSRSIAANLDGTGTKTSSESGNMYVSTDTAGSVGTLTSFEATIVLPESRTYARQSVWLGSASISFLNSAPGEAESWLESFEPKIIRQGLKIYMVEGYTAFSRLVSATLLPVGSTTPVALSLTTSPGWYYFPQNQSLTALSSANAFNHTVPQEMFTNPVQSGLTGCGIATVQIEWSNPNTGEKTISSHSCQVIKKLSGGASPSGTYTRNVETTAVTPPPAPIGLAAQTLSEMSVAFYQGSCTLSLTAWTQAHRLFRVDGVSTPIQRVSIDVGTRSATLTFGPPSHLRPSDLISLMSAARK